jgi:predicted transcriptional regulator
MIVFLSIHPQHAESILEGRKWFEFRRVPPRNADRIVFYATTPVQRVVGYAQVKQIIGDSPDRLWERCSAGAGIDRKYFDEYFAGRDQAFAIEVAAPHRLRHPVEVASLGKFSVPQSYSYLDGGRFGRLLAKGNRLAA